MRVRCGVQFNLGWILRGQGDMQQAVRWYWKSAEQVQTCEVPGGKTTSAIFSPHTDAYLMIHSVTSV
jgi:hypothetical protein